MLLIMKISEDQLIEVSSFPNNMAIRVVEFLSRGYKIRNIFALESLYPKEIIESIIWINVELSKIGHHFSNKVI